MKQSRTMSFVESIINIAVGFGISLFAQWSILPLLGVAINFRQNIAFAVIMTVISIARQFVLRRVFEALHIRRPLSPFMKAVVAERFRQIEEEGFDHAHDDGYEIGELAKAGSNYIYYASDPIPALCPPTWPWERRWWKPRGMRRDLVRGCALAIAEGEKLDRNRKAKPKIQGGYQPSESRPRGQPPHDGSSGVCKYDHPTARR
jgi:hypothetical protein